MKCSICEEPIENKNDIAEVIDGEPVCVDCAEDDDDSEDDDEDEEEDLDDEYDTEDELYEADDEAIREEQNTEDE